MRYRRYHSIALAMHARIAAEQFLTHADGGLRHASQLAAHIVQLGGMPACSPLALMHSDHAGSIKDGSLASMIRDALIVTGGALDSYRYMLGLLATSDALTRHMLVNILAAKEHHADALSELLVSRHRASVQLLAMRRPLQQQHAAMLFGLIAD
jgi:bacterioferritin (cytochrome b1)